MNRNSVTAAEGTEGNRNEHQWGYRDHQTHGMSERTETLDHDGIRPPEHSVEGYPRHEVHLREVQGRLTELAPYAFPGEETPEWAEKAKEYRSALHEHQHLRDGSDPWLYNMPP